MASRLGLPSASMKTNPSPVHDPDLELIFDSDDAFFRCPGCRLSFNSADNLPKDLKCGHPICHRCLQDMLLNQGQVHCPQCPWSQYHQSLDEFTTNRGIKTAAMQTEKYARLIAEMETRNRKLQFQLLKTALWCDECTAIAGENCYVLDHDVEDLQTWFGQGMAKLKLGLPTLSQSMKEVFQQKKALKEHYQTAEKLLNSILLEIKFKITQLSTSMDAMSLEMGNWNDLPVFPYEEPNIGKEACLKRLKQLLNSFDYWSEEVNREAQANPLAELMSNKTRILYRMPSLNESDAWATLQAVVEMELASPTNRTVASTSDALPMETASVPPALIPIVDTESSLEPPELSPVTSMSSDSGVGFHEDILFESIVEPPIEDKQSRISISSENEFVGPSLDLSLISSNSDQNATISASDSDTIDMLLLSGPLDTAHVGSESLMLSLQTSSELPVLSDVADTLESNLHSPRPPHSLSPNDAQGTPSVTEDSEIQATSSPLVTCSHRPPKRSFGGYLNGASASQRWWCSLCDVNFENKFLWRTHLRQQHATFMRLNEKMRKANCPGWLHDSIM